MNDEVTVAQCNGVIYITIDVSSLTEAGQRILTDYFTGRIEEAIRVKPIHFPSNPEVATHEPGGPLEQSVRITIDQATAEWVVNEICKQPKEAARDMPDFAW